MSNNQDQINSMAKYKIGSTIWFVDFAEPCDIMLGESYDCFMSEHPYFTLTRTPYKHVWKSGRQIPKIEAQPFDNIVTLLVGKLAVRSVVVENILRSETTGEYVYLDSMATISLPEQIVYSERCQAQKEKTRILKMIRDWATAQLEDNDGEMFSVSKSDKKQSDRCSDNRPRRTRN